MLGKPTFGVNNTSLPTKSSWCHYFNIFDMLSGIGQVPPTHPPLPCKSKRNSRQNVWETLTWLLGLHRGRQCKSAFPCVLTITSRNIGIVHTRVHGILSS